MKEETYLEKYKEASKLTIKLRKLGKKLPWETAAHNIRQRCENPNASKYRCYGGKGVLCLIKVKGLRDLYFRDKAWTLNNPSVDRINSNGNYEMSNIRWVEFDENRRRGKMNKKKRKNKGILTSVWIDDKTVGLLKEKAKADDRNVSETVRHIIKTALAEAKQA